MKRPYHVQNLVVRWSEERKYNLAITNDSIGVDHDHAPSHAKKVAHLIGLDNQTLCVDEQWKRKLMIGNEAPVLLNRVGIDADNLRTSPPIIFPMVTNAAELPRTDRRLIPGIEEQNDWPTTKCTQSPAIGAICPHYRKIDLRRFLTRMSPTRFSHLREPLLLFAASRRLQDSFSQDGNIRGDIFKERSAHSLTANREKWPGK
jgi:hypothetical protein